MTYEAFKAYKIARHQNSIDKAREMVAKDNKKMAAWYLNLAAITRQSITA